METQNPLCVEVFLLYLALGQLHIAVVAAQGVKVACGTLVLPVKQFPGFVREELVGIVTRAGSILGDPHRITLTMIGDEISFVMKTTPTHVE